MERWRQKQIRQRRSSLKVDSFKRPSGRRMSWQNWKLRRRNCQLSSAPSSLFLSLALSVCCRPRPLQTLTRAFNYVLA